MPPGPGSLHRTPWRGRLPSGLGGEFAPWARRPAIAGSLGERLRFWLSQSRVLAWRAPCTNARLHQGISEHPLLYRRFCTPSVACEGGGVTVQLPHQCWGGQGSALACCMSLGERPRCVQRLACPSSVASIAWPTGLRDTSPLGLSRRTELRDACVPRSWDGRPPPLASLIFFGRIGMHALAHGFPVWFEPFGGPPLRHPPLAGSPMPTRIRALSSAASYSVATWPQRQFLR